MESIISLLTPKKLTNYIDENSTVRQALEKFDAHRFTVVPLIDQDGKYCGTLSEGDLLRFIKNEAHFDLKVLETIKVKSIEHYRPYRPLRIDAMDIEVLTLSMEQNFIPILDDNGVYIGIIKRREVLKYLTEKKNILG